MRMPSVPAIFACLLLFGLAEIGGAVLGAFPTRIQNFTEERAVKNPSVHGLEGIEDIDRTILAKLSSTALSRLHTFHLHAHGIGLLSFVMFTVIINSGFSGRTQKTLNILTALGMVYPFGWLSIMFMLPVTGSQQAFSLAEKLFFMPFGGAMLLAIWSLFFFYGKKVFDHYKRGNS